MKDFRLLDQQAESLMNQGRELFIEGVLLRSKCYSEYMSLGNSQRKTAEYFKVDRKTVANYLKVGGHDFLLIAEPSLRNMIAAVDSKNRRIEAIRELLMHEGEKKEVDFIVDSMGTALVPDTLEETINSLRATCFLRGKVIAECFDRGTMEETLIYLAENTVYSYEDLENDYNYYKENI